MDLDLLIPDQESKTSVRVPDHAAPRLFAASGVRATPQVEWIEITVKSAINRVLGMPFRWSINPYRGCAHACVYCMWGDTPILMGNGSTKPLCELRVGDVIYGTQRHGAYRRYVRTPVLAHWSATKDAYRVVLDDGTELIASSDHRFLSDRGWKYVIGTEQGSHRRPHLTTGNKLMGVGAFGRPPVKDEDYKRGYLCGLIRGDAHIGTYTYLQADGSRDIQHRFRLALSDDEALMRAKTYLSAFSVPTRHFLFQKATASTSAMWAIRVQAKSHVDAIRGIVGWPAMPSLSWYKGFLAGIFDAGGHHGAHALRIINTDDTLIAWTARALRQIDFDVEIEYRSINRTRPIQAVRICGGLQERLRFLHTTDPAIMRKRVVEGGTVKSTARLGVKTIEPLGARELFDITTGTGDFIANGIVSHNCYARVTHSYLDQDGVNDWASRIYVKVNAPEVLRRELARPSWPREQIAIGTATDPYQPAEGAYRITRRVLEALRDFTTPASIVTKSTMILRDRDVLAEMARGPGVVVYFSITTVDPALAREIEPDVPPPAQRLAVMRALAAAGIPVGVLLAPVLPGLTDDEDHLAAVVEAAREHGARSLGTMLLHLGDVARDAYFQYLEHKHPDLLPEYARLYRGRYAPRAYQEQVQKVVAALKRRLRFPAQPAARGVDRDRGRATDAGAVAGAARPAGIQQRLL